jgi:hypothetical protein
MDDDPLTGLEQWLLMARKSVRQRDLSGGAEAAAVLDVLYSLRSIVDRTIDNETVRGRIEGAPWGSLASSKQAAQLRHKRAVARGINPHAVKDGPYSYELTADGTPLADLPQRYHVIAGGAEPPLEGYVWSCVELPMVQGSITDLRRVHAIAKAAIEDRLGCDDVAVYLDVSNITFDFELPTGLGG